MYETESRSWLAQPAGCSMLHGVAFTEGICVEAWKEIEQNNGQNKKSKSIVIIEIWYKDERSKIWEPKVLNLWLSFDFFSVTDRYGRVICLAQMQVD